MTPHTTSPIDAGKGWVDVHGNWLTESLADDDVNNRSPFLSDASATLRTITKVLICSKAMLMIRVRQRDGYRAVHNAINANV